MRPLAFSFLTFSFIIPAALFCAPPILYEPFDYEAGGLIPNSAGNWTLHGIGSGTEINVNDTMVNDSASLEWSNATVTGCKIELDDATGETASHGFNEVSGDGNSVYYSLLVCPETLPTTTESYFIYNTSSTPQFARLYTKRAASGNVAYGIRARSSDATAYSPTEIAVGEVAYIVVRYTFDSENGDSAAIFLNPDPAQPEPSPDAETQIPPAESASAFTSINLRQGIQLGGMLGKLFVDEIRVSTTWTDVHPEMPVDSHESDWLILDN